jgi:hypothetical protein
LLKLCEALDPIVDISTSSSLVNTLWDDVYERYHFAAFAKKLGFIKHDVSLDHILNNDEKYSNVTQEECIRRLL